MKHEPAANASDLAFVQAMNWAIRAMQAPAVRPPVRDVVPIGSKAKPDRIP